MALKYACFISYAHGQRELTKSFIKQLQSETWLFSPLGLVLGLGFLPSPRCSGATMERHPLNRHPLRSLFTLSGARSRRASSWDRCGGNRDYIVVGPGETVTLLDHDGPGCITHIYCASPSRSSPITAMPSYAATGRRGDTLRRGALGDFFGLAHARIRLLHSALVSINPASARRTA